MDTTSLLAAVESNPLSRLVVDIITFINKFLVPLVFAVAFIFFLFGVFRYFFSTGADAAEKRVQGRSFIVWGIIALAIMFAVWGLVNVILGSFDIGGKERPCLPTFSGDCNSGDPTRSTGAPATPGR